MFTRKFENRYRVSALKKQVLNKDPLEIRDSRLEIGGGADKWLSMSEAALLVPYSAEYLSLLARRGKLVSKKIGNTWYTTKTALEDYMKRQMVRTQVQNGNYHDAATGFVPGEVLSLAPKKKLLSLRKPTVFSKNFLRMKPRVRSLKNI